MKTSTYQKVCFLMIIFLFAFVGVIFCVYNRNTRIVVNAASPKNNESLSQMTEDECIDFIIDKGVEIPSDFIDSPNLGKIIKSIIVAVESDPNYEFSYSYNVSFDFSESIRFIVNDYYGIQGSLRQQNSLGSRLSVYTLQDSVFVSNSGYMNYNCYAYSIGRNENPPQYATLRQYQPGDFSHSTFGMNLTISQMAEVVKEDLKALGYNYVSITTTQPNVQIGENLICIRKGSDDYHFMQYNAGYWYHKPGFTSILKYNYQPTNDRIWIGEYVDMNGNAGLSFITYDSDIYFIKYGSEFTWSVENNFATLTGIKQDAISLENITIPSSINGFSVREISNSAFVDQSGLVKVTIPKTVTNIGNSVFANCTNLTNIEFEEDSQLTYIGSNAFDGCTNLEAITLPIGLEQIYQNTFAGCNKLKTITIPAKVDFIGNYAFQGCTELEEVIFANGINIDYIGVGAFQCCYSLTEIAIPDGVTRIDDYAFQMSGLTIVGLSNESALSIVGTGAFNQTAIRYMIIPSGVTMIGMDAFSSCTLLTTVYYGGESETDWSSISIGTNNTYLTNAQKYYYEEDLSKATGLSHWRYVGNTPTAWPVVNFMSLTANGGLQSTTTQLTLEFDTSPGASFRLSNIVISGASKVALDYTGEFRILEITAITVGNGGIVSLTLTNTTEVIFANPSKQVSVYVYSGPVIDGINYTMLSDGSGYEVSSANLSSTTRTVNILSTVNGVPVVRIGNSAFAGCTNLTLVNIPSSVTFIGSSAFENCTSLIGFVVPENMTGIGIEAFKNCTSLSILTIKSNMLGLGDYAFKGCSSLTSVVIPTGVEYMGVGVFDNCNYLTIYTSYTSAPSGWSSNSGLSPIIGGSDWNIDSRPVFWGCTLRTTSGVPYVYSITLNAIAINGGSIENANAINGISAPTRAGYTFGGWYNNANYTGTAISATGIANYLTGTYYVKWTSSGGILPILSDVEQYELTLEEIAIILGVNLEEENY